MSARRLFALVSQLPPDGAVARAAGGSWSNELEIAAATAESLELVHRSLISMHHAWLCAHWNPKFPKPDPPQFGPHPWFDHPDRKKPQALEVEPERPKPATATEIHRFLSRVNA